MLWCLLLLGGCLAASPRAGGSGAVLRMDVRTIGHAISTALNESDVLQKLGEGATKKKADTKPIKGISGLKVMELRATEVALQLSPAVGISMDVLVQMTLKGKRFIGGKMEIPVAANLSASSRMVRDMQGCPRLSTGRCHVALLCSWTNVPPRMLPLVVSTLQKALRDLLCPAMDMVLDLVNAKFATMMYAIPLGNAGMLQYALLNPPTVTEAFIQLELKTILRSKEGEEVALPTDLPPLTSFPPKREATTQLVLAASFLNAELSVMQASFGLNITNGMVLGLLPLVTTMLGALIPEISSMLPPSRPVVIEMQEAQPPLVTITPEKSTVHLYSTAEFWASTPGSAPESLFVLDVHSELGVRFAVAEERLQFSLMLHSLSQVAVVNSSIGAFNVLSLRGALADIIHVAYVPSINRALRGGVPLPPLLGAPYQHVELRQMQDGLVLDVPVAEH
ncbi:BPI fold-containing family B member 6-like isoform X6 [Numida meleagris]|uniref:BPI fold-containing family B member 6-like isoform X6 n=1 Tax=Numida meleagris TaxID=8996 RepID=UPI000B3DCFD4|nr:BPI fold-containing family B member 6-like isoform X6 [Numida meleagris]